MFTSFSKEGLRSTQVLVGIFPLPLKTVKSNQKNKQNLSWSLIQIMWKCGAHAPGGIRGRGRGSCVLPGEGAAGQWGEWRALSGALQLPMKSSSEARSTNRYQSQQVNTSWERTCKHPVFIISTPLPQTCKKDKAKKLKRKSKTQKQEGK